MTIYEIRIIAHKLGITPNKKNKIELIKSAGPAPTVRANRDTLYTVGLYDNSKGIYIEQPDNGIFQSALVLDENAFAKDYVWSPGGFSVEPTDGFVLIIFRIGLEEGIEKARRAQKTLKVSNFGKGTYVTPPYNKAERDELWSMLNKQAIASGIFLEYAYDEDTIDPLTRALSNAAGWGGWLLVSITIKCLITLKASNACRPPLKTLELTNSGHLLCMMLKVGYFL